MSISLEAGKNLLARLNNEQIAAVTQGFGPSLVIAGAGSGKTTVLIRRIAFLLSELSQDPESILAVTFTNKAAAEMKQRVQIILGENQVRNLAIGTFHSICARLLRQEIELYEAEEGWRWGRNFVIYDETDSVNILKSQIAKLNLDEKIFPAKQIKHAISSIKNDGLLPGRYATAARTHRENRLAQIYASYQGELASNNALDFDDLILIFNELLRTNQSVLDRQHRRFSHIMVDEFQDTNKAQYDLISMLATGSPDLSKSNVKEHDKQERSLMVVGDVDQSIYSWRKADFRIILGFQNDFPHSRLIKLEENYRSTATILAVANSIIANNTERLEKVLRCNRGQGAKVQAYEASDEIDEAYYVTEEIKRLQARGRALSDIAILYRTNAQSRAIEEVLVRNNIPYALVGGTRFYQRQEIKDALAYLKLIYNEKDSQAFLRIINVPRRGIGKVALERLYDFAAQQEIGLVEACIKAQDIEGLSAKARQTIKDFGLRFRHWQALAQANMVSELLAVVLKESGYREMLEEEARTTKDELVIGRLENIQELLAVAKEFEAIADQANLDSFLTRISLVSDLDNLQEGQAALTLMTLHSAKGLEFPAIFLMGLEEGLFPHIRSLDSPSALEEERRLMYVGVTRAADLLYITLARRRMLFGGNTYNNSGFGSNYSIPSRFLKEISSDLLIGFYPHPPSETEDQESSFQSNRTPVAPLGKANAGRANRLTSDNAPIRMSGIADGAKKLAVDDQQFDSQPYVSLKVGDLVQHNKFGIGKVVQIIGEKNKELYNVEFKEAGKRLLDPRFARLIKIS
jgi:DNA helicase-2/ATP-dependent DNA helicase PcrA